MLQTKANKVYLSFISSHGRSVCCEGKTMLLHFLLYKAVAPGSHFFPFRQRNVSVFQKTSHLDAYNTSASASPSLTAEGNEMPSKKCHILMSAVMFSTNSL